MQRQLAPGDVFAGYRIDSLAGRGGMGLVYRAWQRRPERMVAVKVIMPELAGDADFRARFEQEAALAAQIEHPNVIPIYGVGDEDGLLYIVMRFVQSKDLNHLLRSQGRLAPGHAAGIVAQIAAALDAAHERGLVHRDVKPANVLVTASEHIYLTDFGLTKRIADFGAGMTQTGGYVGTLDYIAPEQVSGRAVDGRGDVYALGCVLYQLLTGVVPFPRDQEVAKIFAHLSMPPPRPSETGPGLPVELDEVVARAMAKEPDDRFQSAGELGRAVHAAVAGLDESTGGRAAAGAPTTSPGGAPAAATWPARTRSRPDARRVRFKLPLAAAHFTGREAELEAIQRTFRGHEPVVVTQAITGLGGVGKSRLAARYVQDHADEYDVVAWIHAEDGGHADLAELAAALGLPVAELTLAERAAEALRWLSGCDERWLLVLDNVASPDRLRDCCPTSGTGRVIVTTRDRGMAQFGAALAVAVFDQATAVDYLMGRAGRAEDRDGAIRLAQALGCLPLALSHAGAYCAAGTSFSDYLELLGALPATELFDSHPEASYARTVASTWQVSIHVAEAEAPLARPVLTMAAYLGPEEIPRGLFDVLVENAATAVGRKPLRDALNALHRLSLVDVDDAAVGMHRLLQKTIRDDLDLRGETHAARCALAAVAGAFPTDHGHPQHWPQSERLLSHVQALAASMPDGVDAAEQLVALLNAAARHLLAADPGARAVDAAKLACATADRLLAPAEPEALAARISLADAYYEVGRTGEAIVLAEGVIADGQRVLPAEHPHTLLVRRNLAGYLYEAGQVTEATELEERVLVDCERILGLEHRDTISTRATLACCYFALGRVAEAIDLEERVLADTTRILGPEHLDTLVARSNLASSYYAAGRTAEALERRERVNASAETILGPDHALTRATRAKLALSYRNAGRTREAIELEERVLADRERILGLEHRDTLSAVANLAVSYREAGRVDEAIALGERVLADRERVLGGEHPDTLRVSVELVTSLRYAGRTGEAIERGEEALATGARVLGPSHPEMTLVRGTLADCYRAAGRNADAERVIA